MLQQRQLRFIISFTRTHIQVKHSIKQHLLYQCALISVIAYVVNLYYVLATTATFPTICLTHMSKCCQKIRGLSISIYHKVIKSYFNAECTDTLTDFPFFFSFLLSPFAPSLQSFVHPNFTLTAVTLFTFVSLYRTLSAVTVLIRSIQN